MYVLQVRGWTKYILSYFDLHIIHNKHTIQQLFIILYLKQPIILINMEEECTMCYTTNILYPMDCSGNHIYCLLCIKSLCYSISPNSKVQCPTCNGVVTRKYIKTICENTKQIKSINLTSLIDNLIANRDILWIYEGRNNGWWYYNKDLQDVLESTFLNMVDTVDTVDTVGTVDWILCGQSITLNLCNMTQLNKNNNAVRSIKRIQKKHITQYLIKGIAGMQ